jgi:hypothetical protein
VNRPYSAFRPIGNAARLAGSIPRRSPSGATTSLIAPSASVKHDQPQIIDNANSQMELLFGIHVGLLLLINAQGPLFNHSTIAND